MPDPHHLLQVERSLDCYDRFDAVSGARNLFALAESLGFDLSRDWFDLMVRTALEPGESLRIYSLLTDKSKLTLILPLKNVAGSKKLTSLANFYTSLFAPIGHLDPDDLIHCFALIRAESPAWSLIRLQPLDRASGNHLKLYSALRHARWLCVDFFCFGNWYLPVQKRQYEEIFQSLNSRVRHTVQRKRKQFARSLGRLVIIEGGERIDSAIADYQKVYASSWKKQEPFPDFIPGLIQLCAARGWLRLGIAYLNDTAIAAQIWIVCHDKASIFKLAYDEDYSSYSAGTLLTDCLMKHVIDVDRVCEVDYLIGDDGYKKDWMTHRRERWGILAFNPRTLAGLVGYFSEIARRILKNFYFSLKGFQADD